jgi:hypothetical protein
MNGSSAGSTGSRSGDSERKPQRLGVSQSCLEASTLSSTFNGTKVQVFSNDAGFRWRKRVGVEPTNDGIARRSPVLKTGTITGPHALPQKPNAIPFQQLV